jgi:hypothetical protein
MLRLLPLAIVLGCTLLVTLRVATAPGVLPARAATAGERAEIARAVAGSEREWAMDTTKNFPADSWSQRDDFHGREYKKVLELAREKGVRVEDVLRAIDDDIHRPHERAAATKIPDVGAPDRHANAVPCKPRPFYD